MTKFVKSQTGTLSNGMKVLYLHLPKAQTSTISVEVPIGAKHDPVGKEGLSHILEHNVFCGTQSLSEEEFSYRLAMMGGGPKAFTGNDTTTFIINVSHQNPDNFLGGADLMRQLLTEPLFPQERLEIENKVVINERADDIDSLDRGVTAKLFDLCQSQSDSAVDVIGTEESILSVTSEDLRNFMAQNYDSGHMHVSASGPLPFDEAMTAFEQTLSAVPNLRQVKKEAQINQLSLVDERAVRADLKQNYTALMMSVPMPRDVKSDLILAEARQHLSSLVVEKLRAQYGCFYSPEFGGWSCDMNNAYLFMRMSSTPEDSAIACEGLIKFFGSIDEYFTDDLLQSGLSRNIYGLSDADRLDSNLASVVGHFAKYFGKEYNTAEVVKTYKQITPNEIRQSAKQIMSGLIGMYVMGPEPHKPPSLAFMQEGLKAALPERPDVKKDFQGPSAPSV